MKHRRSFREHTVAAAMDKATLVTLARYPTIVVSLPPRRWRERLRRRGVSGATICKLARGRARKPCAGYASWPLHDLLVLGDLGVIPQIDIKIRSMRVGGKELVEGAQPPRDLTDLEASIEEVWR